MGKIQDAVIRHAREDMARAPGASEMTPNETSLWAAIKESLTDPEQYAVLWAEGRRGLKDLQVAVLGNWAGTHEEPGTIANPTQMIVTQEMGGFDAEVARYSHGVHGPQNKEIER